ncbi:MAG: patatin-like phospholipase family protein [Spirochaetota bacterium]
MKWALVLSGGGARGLAHIGIIKELERLGVPPPSLVVGTSMGAIIGALYASGWNAARLEGYAKDFDIRKHIENPAFKLPDFAPLRILRAGSAMSGLLGSLALDTGTKASQELGRLLGDLQIEDMPIPFACAATDLLSGKRVVLESGPVVMAIRASMSFPGLFTPVWMDNMLLVDGGVTDNIPVDIAAERGFEHILACDVSRFKQEKASSFRTGLSVLIRSYDIAIERARKTARKTADLILYPEGGGATFDFRDPIAYIGLGERTAEDASEEINRFFGLGASRIISRIATLFGWKPSTKA